MSQTEAHRVPSRISILGRAGQGLSLVAGLLLGIIGCGGGGNTGSNPTPGQSDAAQVTYLKRSVKPFSTVEPAAPDGELAFLDAMVGNARVVGLGEATHGTSEFQRMKHRIFRYLVEHKGFRAFGIEGQMGRCMAIDRYLQTGEGDPARLARGMGFWTWTTTEVVDLLTWMRAYNLDPAHAEKLRFFGFDMQDGTTEMDRVLAYLHPLDPAAENALATAYAPLRPYTDWDHRIGYETASASLRQQCHEGVRTAHQWLADHREVYVQATGLEAYEWTLRLAATVVQTEGMLAADLIPNDWVPGDNARDAAMAENAAWFVQTRMPGVKAVLWAHNGHLNHSYFYDPQGKPMGQWLLEQYPGDYVSVGFAFNGGTALAKPLNSDGTYGALQAVTVPPLTVESFTGAFILGGIDRGVLDLREAKTSAAEGAAWWRSDHYLREFGAVWSDIPTFGTWQNYLANRFHLLIYIKDSTPTHYYTLPGTAAPEPAVVGRAGSRHSPGAARGD